MLYSRFSIRTFFNASPKLGLLWFIFYVLGGGFLNAQQGYINERYAIIDSLKSKAAYDEAFAVAQRIFAKGQKEQSVAYQAVALERMAHILLWQHKLDSALLIYQQANDLVKKWPDGKYVEASIAYGMGYIYTEQLAGQGKAAAMLQRAIDIYASAKDTLQVVNVSTMLARSWLGTQQPEKSYEVLNQAGKLLKAYSKYDTAVWLNYYTYKAGSFGSYGSGDSTVFYAKKGLALADAYYGALQNHKHNVFYTILGEGEMARGNYQQAIKALNLALLVADRLGQEYMQGTGPERRYLAMIYTSMGNYKEAMKYAEQALRLFREVHGDIHYRTAQIYGVMGDIYANQKQFSQARILYKKAIDIAEERMGQHASTAQYYEKLARLLVMEENYQEALNALVLSNDYLSQMQGDFNRLKSKNYALKARIHYAQKSYKKGIEAIDYALALLAKSGKKTQTVLITYNLTKAQGFFYLKDYKQAKQLLAACFEQAQSLDEPSAGLMANYYLLEGKVLEAQQEWLPALQAYQNSIDQNSFDSNLPGLNDYPTAKTVFSNKEKLIEAVLKKANLLARIPVDTTEQNRIIANLGYVYVDSLLTSWRRGVIDAEDRLKVTALVPGLYKHAFQNAMGLYKQTKSPIWLNTAFIYAEKGRAGTLTDLALQNSAIRFAGIPDSLINQERSLRALLTNIESKYFKRGNANLTEAVIQAAQDSVKERYYDLRQQLTSLIAFTEKNYPEYYMLKHQRDVASLRLLSYYLPPQTAVLEYVLYDSTLTIFVAAKNLTQKVEVAIDSAQLVQQIKAFNNGIKQRSENLNAQGFDLYNVLVEPVQSLLPAKTQYLHLVPDGLLWNVNFELLHTQKTNNKDPRAWPYLLRKYAVAYQYSATLMLHDIESEASDNNKVLAFAYEDSGKEAGVRRLGSNTNTGDLPGSRKEISAIANVFEGQYYYGDSASETRFKQKLNQYGVLHLAVHAEANNLVPEQSKLIFTPNAADSLNDGQLYAYELYDLQVQADMAVLSACNTGVGSLSSGEGLLHLGHAFDYAGVKSMVLTQWEVTDDVAPTLMAAFYDGLSQGMRKDQALNYAKLQYLETSSAGQADPYYWGHYIVIGNPAPLPNPFSIWRTVAWILPLLLLPVATLLRFRWQQKQLRKQESGAA